jgi:hypothetical protein
VQFGRRISTLSSRLASAHHEENYHCEHDYEDYSEAHMIEILMYKVLLHNDLALGPVTNIPSAAGNEYGDDKRYRSDNHSGVERFRLCGIG